MESILSHDDVIVCCDREMSPLRKRKKDMYFFAGDVLTCLPEQRC